MCFSLMFRVNLIIKIYQYMQNFFCCISFNLKLSILKKKPFWWCILKLKKADELTCCTCCSVKKIDDSQRLIGVKLRRKPTYLFSATQGAILQGIGSLVLALSAVQRPQVLKGGGDGRGIYFSGFVPTAVFSVRGVFPISSFVLFTFLSHLPNRFVVTYKQNSRLYWIQGVLTFFQFSFWAQN